MGLDERKEMQNFSVKSFYSALYSLMNGSFPYKIVWKSGYLLKVSFFIWDTSLDKILTVNNIKKRG